MRSAMRALRYRLLATLAALLWCIDRLDRRGPVVITRLRWPGG
jgi:hypothetical protein